MDLRSRSRYDKERLSQCACAIMFELWPYWRKAVVSFPDQQAFTSTFEPYSIVWSLCRRLSFQSFQVIVTSSVLSRRRLSSMSSSEFYVHVWDSYIASGLSRRRLNDTKFLTQTACHMAQGLKSTTITREYTYFRENKVQVFLRQTGDTVRWMHVYRLWNSLECNKFRV